MVTPKPKSIIEMNVAERETLLNLAAESGLAAEHVERIRAVFDSYAYISELIEQKNLSLARLRKILFGDQTETSANVLGTGRRGKGPPADQAGSDRHQEDAASTSDEAPATTSAEPEASAADRASTTSNTKKPRRGHGRNGANKLRGAVHVQVPLAGLVPGSICPACGDGRLYEVNQSGILVRFVGQSPVRAHIYELQKLRCNLCGELFTAEPPREAGAEKYDATVGSLIGILKYGHGFPFHRFAKMQDQLDLPLAASTQWGVVALAAESYLPAYKELIRQAAQGELMSNDDTTAKILAWMGRRRPATVAAAAEAKAAADPEATVPPAPAGTTVPDLNRTGLYTTGIVAEHGSHRIALFFTGRRHAGENLEAVLRRRATDLPPPIQMCDALSRNYPHAIQTIVANCLAHARRKFVEVKDNFLAECEYVLGALAEVYAADDNAKEKQLTPEERLRYHQQVSSPVMERLREWLEEQIEERQVEPNSPLGAAIDYLRGHWTKLTLFLRVPGAPLDNNVVERALKKAILHRKNALFYKTDRGAAVGDIHMSLIHTCELCGENPFEYLTQLQRHAAAVAADPASWMPWNYRDALATLGATS